MANSQGAYVLSLALFIVACAAPAVEGKRAHPPGAMLEFSDTGTPVVYRGWEALALGWVVVLAEVTDANGPLHPFNVGGLVWLANPLILAGVVLLRYRRWTAATVCGWLGVGLGVIFLVSPAVDQGRPLVPLVGAYLWVGSLVVFAVGVSAAGLPGWRRSPTIHAQPIIVRDGGNDSHLGVHRFRVSPGG